MANAHNRGPKIRTTRVSGTPRRSTRLHMDVCNTESHTLAKSIVQRGGGSAIRGCAQQRGGRFTLIPSIGRSFETLTLIHPEGCRRAQLLAGEACFTPWHCRHASCGAEGLKPCGLLAHKPWASDSTINRRATASLGNRRPLDVQPRFETPDLARRRTDAVSCASGWGGTSDCPAVAGPSAQKIASHPLYTMQAVGLPKARASRSEGGLRPLPKVL